MADLVYEDEGDGAQDNIDDGFDVDVDAIVHYAENLKRKREEVRVNAASMFCNVICFSIQVFQDANDNIRNAQKRQKKDYNKRHANKRAFEIGEKVLLYNLRRADRKGGKQQDVWDGPYTVAKIFNNGNYTRIEQ